MKTYSELITYPTFEERFNYIKEDGVIGDETFGYLRILNQEFYQSETWKQVRREIIARDGGYDLGIFGLDITGQVYVHHLNPITVEDLMNHNPDILNPEFLITMSELTHKAIHYGDLDILKENDLVVRTKNDTCPWRQL